MAAATWLPDGQSKRSSRHSAPEASRARTSVEPLSSKSCGLARREAWKLPDAVSAAPAPLAGVAVICQV
ncbi:hypothetical protein ACFWBX_10165 [Streptomyces sp. NPDC059991]|uniref:hypothetical protein n=1 Tax=Streptomyces sp. NPDC059991 TaxID=3347028 RepID=UPI00368314AF